MLRDASRNEADLPRLLRDQRETLQAFEATALASIAAELSAAAESLALTAERLERMRPANMVVEEDLAREMGYVNNEGEVEKKQFVTDMVRAGVDRHKTSRTRAFYFRDEVEAAIRALGE